MNTQKTIGICIIFLFGFLSANLLGLYLIYGFETPLSFSNFSLNNLSWNSLGFSSENSPAPFDFVKENQIEVYEDKIIINVKDASISKYAPTGSMLPVLDEGSNGIRIKPTSEVDIHIGDIISFRQDSYSIVHRVVEIRTDVNGTYFITKGDNNPVSDEKIRFTDIEYITIGVIW